MKPSIIPADAAVDSAESVSVLTQMAKPLLIAQLRKIRDGRLRLIDGGSVEIFGAVTETAPFDHAASDGVDILRRPTQRHPHQIVTGIGAETRRT